jgi:predicted phosphoribosyltransferase
VALLAAWLLVVRQEGRPWAAGALAALAGASLGWALVVHVGADLRESLSFRQRKLNIARAFAPVVPDRSAILVYGDPRDALGLLHLDRDVVIVDIRADRGATAIQMIRALLARGRRVFLVATGMSPATIAALAGPAGPRVALDDPPVLLLELGGRP